MPMWLRILAKCVAFSVLGFHVMLMFASARSTIWRDANVNHQAAAVGELLLLQAVAVAVFGFDTIGRLPDTLLRGGKPAHGRLQDQLLWTAIFLGLATAGIVACAYI